jgi:predicted esterase
VTSPRLRGALAAAAFGLAVLLLLAGSGQRAEGKPKKPSAVAKGPKGVAFYEPPKPLPEKHGALIWARKASGLAPLADARYTKLVLYSSRTPQGKRTAVSGTVSVPRGKPPKGGWPVISWAHGTTGVADVCAPSRNSAFSSYLYSVFNEWLRAGYAIAQTDYQGLGTPGKHPYLIGKAEGRSVLDIVKAARRLDPDLSRRFLISGHSQGGHAALFAAGEARSWTPRLRLRGTASFAPGSHILEQVPLLSVFTSPNPLTGLGTIIVYGASTQSSAIDVNQLLSDEVLALYPLLQTQCIGELIGPSSLGGIPPSQLQRPGADLSPLNPVLAAMNPLVKSAAPILIAQGADDSTVFPIFTDQLNTELVNAGNQVTYSKYTGVGHGDIVSAAAPETLAFFRSLLPGRGG